MSSFGSNNHNRYNKRRSQSNTQEFVQQYPAAFIERIENSCLLSCRQTAHWSRGSTMNLIQKSLCCNIEDKLSLPIVCVIHQKYCHDYVKYNMISFSVNDFMMSFMLFHLNLMLSKIHQLTFQPPKWLYHQNQSILQAGGLKWLITLIRIFCRLYFHASNQFVVQCHFSLMAGIFFWNETLQTVPNPSISVLWGV